MARNKLIQTCDSNARLFASTGKHESKKPVVQELRSYEPVQDEDKPNEFDAMMRSNRGVL